MPGVFAPLLSHLPLAGNVLALGVDHTAQGLHPALLPWEHSLDLWHKLPGPRLAVPRVGGCWCLRHLINPPQKELTPVAVGVWLTASEHSQGKEQPRLGMSQSPDKTQRVG